MATNSCTVVFKLGFPAGMDRYQIAKVIYDEFSSAHSVLSIQVLPAGVCKVMFESPESKKSLVANPESCQVLNHIERSIQVQVHHFPAEDDPAPLVAAMRAYGEIVNFRFQTWPGLPHVNTGTRLFEMKLKSVVPRSLKIGKYHLKTWYRGQPLQCDICGGNHTAAVCELRGKCRRCRSEGHLAKDCPRPPWSGDGPSAASVLGPAPALGPALASASASAVAPVSGGVVSGSDLDLRDNQLGDLDSQAPPSRALSAVDENVEDASESVLPPMTADLSLDIWDRPEDDITDNERLTSTNVVVSNENTDNSSDRDRVSGICSAKSSDKCSAKSSDKCSEKSSDKGSNDSSIKTIGNCMPKTVTPESSVGQLDVGENPDVDMSSGKRGAPDDSSELDSVDSCPVVLPLGVVSKLKKSKLTVVGVRRDTQNRPSISRTPVAGRHSLPQQSKSVPLRSTSLKR